MKKNTNKSIALNEIDLRNACRKCGRLDNRDGKARWS
jgi:hypothetical protein